MHNSQSTALEIQLIIAQLVVFLEKEIIVGKPFDMNFLRLLVEQFLQLVDICLVFGRDEDAVVVHLRHPGLLEVLETHILAGGGGEVVGILRGILEGVDLVEDENLGFTGSTAHLAQRLVDHLYLLLEIRMAHIHHMHQQVGLSHLVERRLEGVYEMGRELADESYCIGEEEGKIVDRHLAHSSVKSREKLVFCKYIALAKEVHDRRLTDVGVAYKRHAGHVAAVLALDALLLVDVLELLFEA